MTALSALRRCLPPTQHERAYALITMVDSIGSGSFLTISVVLFVRLVGVSPTQVGLGLAIGGVLSLFARVPLGRLSDRIGHRRTLMLVHLVRGLVFPAYLIIHGFAAFLALSAFILIVDGWESPVRKVILYAFADAKDRVRIAAYNRSVYNLAFAIGALLAALALTNQGGRLSLELVVAGNAISFLAAAALAARLPTELALPAPGAPAGIRRSRFAVVGLLCGSLFLCTSILTIGVPLLVLQHFHSQQWLIGVAMFVNTAAAVSLQVRLSRGSSDIAGATRAGLLGGLTLALACLLFFTVEHAPTGLAAVLLLVGVLTLSLGELLATAATWGLGLSLRRNDVTAHNQSVWSMYNSLPLLLGPYIVTSLLHAAHSAAWLVMAAFIALAALLLRPVALSVNDGIDREKVALPVKT